MKLLANLELKDIVAGGGDIVVGIDHDPNINGAPDIKVIDTTTFQHLVEVTQMDFTSPGDPAPDLIFAHGEYRRFAVL